MRIFVLVLVCAAGLYGQRKFRWQEYCFNNPGSPVCKGNDYAIKPQPKSAPSKDVATNPFPSTPRSVAPRTISPSLIVLGKIDWRFADPFADAVIGFNFSGLVASPLARSLIVQLGARQGISEADVQKLFDGLSGVDQVALSLRNNRAVVMVTGGATDSATLPSPESGLKVVPVSGNGVLVGHPDAVDQALGRIAMKGPLGELAQLAEQRQSIFEFWALGSPAFVGPQAVSAGVKRFSLTASIRNRLASDIAFEFNGVPSANTLRTWQTTLGAATLEGNTVHLRTSIEADEVEQKLGQIIDGPLGPRLAALVEGARYLPARDTSVPKRTKPVIYGLDGGPQEAH